MDKRTNLVLVCILGGASAVFGGCGMRSVLSEDVDGPAPAPILSADAGLSGPSAGKGGQPGADAGRDSGSNGVGQGMHPCGRAGAQGCDATDLDGHSCQSLGAGSGTLACDPATCVFDLSMCSGTGGGGTAGTPGGGGNAGAPGGGVGNLGGGGTGAGAFGGGMAGGGNAGGGFFGGGNAGGGNAGGGNRGNRGNVPAAN